MLCRDFFYFRRAAFFLCVYAVCAAAQQQYSIDAEIARLKKEIGRIESERAKVREEAARDAGEFSHYQERHRRKIRALTAETDSVRAAAAAMSRRSDSLGAALARLNASGRELDLTREHVREKLVALCQTSIAAVESLPPSLSEQGAAALAFLKSELVSKSIDNVEGLHRLVTILNDLENQLMDIQIMQGASPVAAIGGACYRIRIGGVFEAVTDSRGEKCAIWTGGSTDAWRVLDNREIASSILKAVNVREGKTLPGLVGLPFGGGRQGGAP